MLFARSIKSLFAALIFCSAAMPNKAPVKPRFSKLELGRAASSITAKPAKPEISELALKTQKLTSALDKGRKMAGGAMSKVKGACATMADKLKPKSEAPAVEVKTQPEATKTVLSTPKPQAVDKSQPETKTTAYAQNNRRASVAEIPTQAEPEVDVKQVSSPQPAQSAETCRGCFGQISKQKMLLEASGREIPQDLSAKIEQLSGSDAFGNSALEREVLADLEKLNASA